MTVSRLAQLGDLREASGSWLACAPGDHGRWAIVHWGGGQLWRGDNLERELPRPPRPVYGARFSRSGHELLAAPQIYDVEAGTWLELPTIDAVLSDTYATPQRLVTAACDDRGGLLAVVSRYAPPREPGGAVAQPSQRVLALDARTRTLLAVLREDDGAAGYEALVLSERLVAAGALDVWVWDRRTFAPIARLTDETASQVRRLAVSPDGGRLAVGYAHGHVSVWSTGDWRLERRWQAHRDDARGVAFHPRDGRLATGGWDDRVMLWSPELDAEAGAPTNGHVSDVAFSADGELLLAARAAPATGVTIQAVGQH